MVEHRIADNLEHAALATRDTVEMRHTAQVARPSARATLFWLRVKRVARRLLNGGL
jgi:hypothetical protein